MTDMFQVNILLFDLSVVKDNKKESLEKKILLEK